MKTRGPLFTPNLRASLYNYVLVILGGLLLCSCIPWVDRVIYRDYSIKPLKYDKEYRKLLEGITNTSEETTKEGERKAPRNGFVDRKCWDGSELSDKEKTNCKYQRNLLIGDLIGISDGMCENHMKTILGNEATMNIIAGTFTNAFSGAATVVSETLAKSILAALAFFSNSERSLINETVYKSVLVPAIMKKINEIRLNERNTIIKKYEDNKNADYEDYPVGFAISDVIKYHQSCSFMLGLQKALEEGTQPAAGQDRASLEQKLKTLVHEKDNRIRELRAMKAGISDEEINNDKYVIYLNGEIDAITRKIGEPEAKKPGDAEITALRKAKDKLKDATAVLDGMSVVVNQVTKLDEAKKQLFVDLTLKKEGKDISEEDAKTITEKDIKQALLKLKEASGLKEENIVIEKCQPPLQK